jgi:predicted alpha/beta superfamily hydrolase
VNVPPEAGSRAMSFSLLPDAGVRPTLEMATVVVRYPTARGKVFLRGNALPLDWEHDTPPASVDGNVSVFRVPVPLGRTIEIKPYREDGRWAYGPNLVVSGRDSVEIAPCFEREHGHLLPWHEIPVPNRPALRVRICLPPAYDEHQTTHHPVLYALDGQALWSDQQDPFGIWSLDAALNELWALGVIDDLIVVSIDTSQGRMDRLGPVPDPVHGGGGGAAFLTDLTEVLIPAVDAAYRTERTRERRAILGSSMGGLFAFYAAFSRPDLFGSAICLSSSFWWAHRQLIRAVEDGGPLSSRPRLYLDSGATASPFAEDANLRDGQHHTRAMLRALLEHGFKLDEDLHVLAFPGERHDAAAWGARVAIPLQLLFPRTR